MKYKLIISSIAAAVITLKIAFVAWLFYDHGRNNRLNINANNRNHIERLQEQQ